MKFAAIILGLASVQAISKLDKETEVALSKQKNKWFEDDIHDDEYSESDIVDSIKDKLHVQLSAEMGKKEKYIDINQADLPEGFEDVDV